MEFLRDKLNLKVSFHKITHEQKISVVECIRKYHPNSVTVAFSGGYNWSAHGFYQINFNQIKNNVIGNLVIDLVDKKTIADQTQQNNQIIVIIDDIPASYSQKYNWSSLLEINAEDTKQIKIIILTNSTNPSYYANLFYLTGRILQNKRAFMAMYKQKCINYDKLKALEDMVFPEFGINLLKVKIESKLQINDELHQIDNFLNTNDMSCESEHSMVNYICVLLTDLIQSNKIVVCVKYEETQKTLISDMESTVEEYGASVVYGDIRLKNLLMLNSVRMVILRTDSIRDEEITEISTRDFIIISLNLPHESLSDISYILRDFSNKPIRNIRPIV